jgi:hypothetical protein
MANKLVVFALCLFASHFAAGQAAPTGITNSDVISMTKAGIGEQTIILAIQRGPVKFDTSPQALITLKGAGVSDQVLNAILASADSKNQTSPDAQSAAAQALFQKALDAIGPHDKVMAVHSVRWKGVVVDRSQSGTRSFERELIKIYPDRAYMSTKAASGQSQTLVVTPDFNYRTTGTMTTSVPPGDLDELRDQFEFDTLQVAQHSEDYTVSSAGQEQIGGIAAAKLRISNSGRSIIWEIDPQTGRLLSTLLATQSGDLLTEFSDWRLVDGVNLGFKRHVTQSQRTSDLTVSECEINPAIDETLFQRPTQAPSQGLTLKILQEQSEPYIQESGGGISTSCNIVGTANTSAYANAYGNSAYGNATTTSNQQMSCNSYDTTMRWPHVLNVMFAKASDGNSYIIACDAAWRWSKCVPLRAGDTFNARFTEKGLEVQSFNTKGKEGNPTYRVLQSKSSQ